MAHPNKSIVTLGELAVLLTVILILTGMLLPVLL